MKAKIVSCVVVIVSICVLALPLAGKQPTINNFQFTGTFLDTELCEFDISGEFNIRVKEVIFFDQAGNATKAQVHVRVEITNTNAATGKTIIERDAFMNIVDLSTGTSTFVGLPFRLKLANGRTIVKDVGKIVFDAAGNITFVAGPHPLADSGFDFAQFFCPALQ
jgi:hypothetical protein